jgi:hypothetical protein
VALALGCSLTGPNTVTTGRPLYNLAVQRTNSEQMLLNLVRLRYRDRPLWLEVSSVSTSFEIEADAGVAVTLSSGADTVWDLGLGGRVMEIPTVTYTPLQGESFVRQLMTPIGLWDLLLLYHSGWAIDRIFRICIQEMNDVPNAPSASGPTPERAPTFEKFATAMARIRELQKQGKIDMGGTEQGEEQIVFFVSDDALDSPEWLEFAQIMSLPRGQSRFEIELRIRRGDRRKISVLTRSMASVLSLLSQGVQVPVEDEAAGRVTVTRHANGELFDWAELTGDLLRVRSSPTEPANAAVRTFYRGSWFYIDDADLESKSTFSLLGQLSNLQAGEVPSTAPLLTLPVGGR